MPPTRMRSWAKQLEGEGGVVADPRYRSSAGCKGEAIRDRNRIGLPARVSMGPLRAYDQGNPACLLYPGLSDSQLVT